jgi:hypothetical protein
LGGDGPLILFNHKTGVKTKLAPPQWNEHTSWVSDLFHDSKGYIWVSAYINYKYHPPTKSFKIIPYHERLLAVAFGIEEDRDGHIWMSGHGIILRWKNLIFSSTAFHLLKCRTDRSAHWR